MTLATVGSEPNRRAAGPRGFRGLERLECWGRSGEGCMEA